MSFPEKFIELYNLYSGKKNDIETEYYKWIEKCEWNVDYDLLISRLKKSDVQYFQSWLNKFRTEPSKFKKIIIEEYQKFHEEQTGVNKVSFNNVDALALEEVSKKIEDAVKSKLNGLNGNLEDNVRQSIELIFNNWDKIDNFYQKQITPSQINKNFSIILKQIKDGVSKKPITKIGRTPLDQLQKSGSTINFDDFNHI